MVQSNLNNEVVDNAPAMWAEAAAKAGYAVHNGLPLIGVSGEKGDGYIVPLTAPSWFASVADENTRINVFRAMSRHAQAVAQAKLKSEKEPSKATAVSAAASALNGSYSPGRERSNDILESAAGKAFEAHIAKLVREKQPDATQVHIDATVTKYSGTDAGKALIAKFRDEAANGGTYIVSRKSTAKADAIELSI